MESGDYMLLKQKYFEIKLFTNLYQTKIYNHSYKNCDPNFRLKSLEARFVYFKIIVTIL